ncbi:hypothetical protein [Chryseobacterium indologenes]|uniref:hypothetical protein n=1 Tax=Chryseobacterium indologenes TaxID=253 RepID=UPI0009A1631B|nr:hypothetical protein [Chryseobacterium indologenes]
MAGNNTGGNMNFGGGKTWRRNEWWWNEGGGNGSGGMHRGGMGGDNQGIPMSQGSSVEIPSFTNIAQNPIELK